MAFGIGEIGKLVAGARSMTDSVAKAVGQTTKLGGAFGSIVDQIGSASESFVDFAGKASEAGGVTDMVTGALKSLGPEGEAVAIVLELVVAAVTALVVTLYDWMRAAVAISQEKDQMAATFAALADGARDAASGGVELVNAVADLAATLPFAEGQVMAWAKSLMAAGIQGEAMERGVRSIAAATALMGKAGGAAAETLLKRFAMTAEIGGKLKLDRRLLTQLAAAGVSAASLAAQLGVPAEKLSTMSIDATKLGDAFQKALAEKGAGALASMGLTWESISGKLSDSWEDLFEDMGNAVQPFMREVQSLFAEFFAGSTAMGPVKSVLTSVLESLFSVATKVVRAVHFGFLLIQIAALKVAIAIAPIVNFMRAIYSNAMVLKGIVAVIALLAAPFVVLIGILGAIVAAVAIVGTAFATVAGIVVGAISWLAGSVISGIQWIRETIGGLGAAAYEAAGNFISGLVGGITGGIGKVIGAVTGLAKAAVGAFGAGIRAKSPSRLMIQMGGYMAEGAAIGMDRGRPRVQAAAVGMSAAAIGGAAAGTRGGGGRGGGPLQVTFAERSIVIDGAGKSALEITEEMVALIFERLAAKEGLAT